MILKLKLGFLQRNFFKLMDTLVLHTVPNAKKNKVLNSGESIWRKKNP
jgi:hypothetical protein